MWQVTMSLMSCFGVLYCAKVVSYGRIGMGLNMVDLNLLKCDLLGPQHSWLESHP